MVPLQRPAHGDEKKFRCREGARRAMAQAGRLGRSRRSPLENWASQRQAKPGVAPGFRCLGRRFGGGRLSESSWMEARSRANGFGTFIGGETHYRINPIVTSGKRPPSCVKNRGLERTPISREPSPRSAFLQNGLSLAHLARRCGGSVAKESTAGTIRLIPLLDPSRKAIRLGRCLFTY